MVLIEFIKGFTLTLFAIAAMLSVMAIAIALGYSVSLMLTYTNFSSPVQTGIGLSVLSGIVGGTACAARKRGSK